MSDGQQRFFQSGGGTGATKGTSGSTERVSRHHVAMIIEKIDTSHFPNKPAAYSTMPDIRDRRVS